MHSNYRIRHLKLIRNIKQNFVLTSFVILKTSMKAYCETSIIISDDAQQRHVTCTICQHKDKN